jgi:hypothetical protein
LLVNYLWPDCRWRQSFARFEEGSRTIKFPGESLEVASSSGVNPP